MKNGSEMKQRSFFSTTFSFVLEYFNITVSELSKNSCVTADSLYYWKTRGHAPKSIEIVEELVDVVCQNLNSRDAFRFKEKQDFINKLNVSVSSGKSLSRIFEYVDDMSFEETIKYVLVFSFYNKDGLPEKSSSISSHKEQSVASSNAIEAIVFDFDGTLTASNEFKTIWEQIWTALGYDIGDCVSLHARFSRGEITHSEWCELTEQKFRERKFSKTLLDSLVKNIKFIDGIEEVFQELDKRDIKIYIVSGSVQYVIRKSLGGLHQYVSGINANVFNFDQEGYLTDIIGTEYDFEGKSARIRKIADELRISTDQILFVGNSNNDEWAHKSGARTLCINPKYTNMYDSEIWDDCIPVCSSLKEILKYL